MSFKSFIFRAAAWLMVLAVVSCAGVKEKKNQAKAHYKLGISHLSSERYQPAFVEFQKSLNLYSGDEEVYNAIGIVYIKLEDYKASEDNFQKAVSLNSKYSEAYNNLCFLYLITGDLSKAERNCLTALKNPLYLTPEKAYYNLGRIHYKAGDARAAIEAYDNAIKRFPTLVPAFYGLALSYNSIKMYGEAADAMDRAINLDPRFRGDREKAIKEFNRLVALREGDYREYLEYIEILNY